jgi:hypothetical protein
MVSPLVSSNRYILQPALIQKHQEVRDWLSSLQLWIDELSFFQKVLADHSSDHQNQHFKMQIDHYQHIFNYYRFEVIDDLKDKLVSHQGHLARMLQNRDETDLVYYQEHAAIIDALKSFQKAFDELKVSFIRFIQGLESPYTLRKPGENLIINEG